MYSSGPERVRRHSTLEDVRREGPSSIRLYRLSLITRGGLKAGGSLHPLLANSLASPFQHLDYHAENQRYRRERRYHRRHRLYTIRHNRSSDHATRTPLPSPLRRPAPDQHQRLPNLHHRRRPEQSLQLLKNGQSSTVPTTTEKKISLHEKYDLQEAVSNKLHGRDVAVIKAQKILREDDLNVDLPVYFLHRSWMKNWFFIKGPTVKPV